MARDRTELIACEECGCLNERATALLDQANDHIDGLERELRIKRAKISRLESDRHDKLAKSKKYEMAMVVLRHWQEVCAPNAKEIDSSERLEKVIARLNGGHTVDELKLCATGYGRYPYVTKEGRSKTGTPSQWRADAELIYRTPEHVRRGVAMAASTTSSEPSTGVISTSSLERVSWRSVQYANRRLIVKALTERFGKPLEDDGYALFPCPRCDNDPALTLRIAPTGMSWLANCSACGIDETRLIAAITEEGNNG